MKHGKHQPRIVQVGRELGSTSSPTSCSKRDGIDTPSNYHPWSKTNAIKLFITMHSEAFNIKI